MIKSISAAQLKELLDKNEAVLIDVREPAEFKASHIPNALLMPLSTITQNQLPEHADKKLVFQCHSGKRSGIACDKVSSMRLTADIYNLEGGILAWTQAGYEVKKSGNFCLPLDRQVQLMIGLALLLGSFLAFAVNPAFLLLTGFLGLGLTFAGLTGFCGLALLMAKMPWNQKVCGKSQPSCCSR